MSFKIVGIGEVLWDLLPAGPQLGGAPANFACHAHALGASASVITRIGQDQLGRAIIDRFQQLDFSTEMIQVDPGLPTGTVSVTLNGDGIPHYVIHENAAWDRIELTDFSTIKVCQANAICFGSLSQRTKPAAVVIQQLVAATSAKTLRVFDVNLRQAFYTQDVIEKSLDLANVLKLNDHELAVLAAMFGLPGAVKPQMEFLAGRFGLRLVALTRGDQGSLLYEAGNWSDLPGSSVQIVDTVGAGDSFTAALVMGLLGGMPLDQLHRAAAEIADFVCSQPGATPALPEHFRAKFFSQCSPAQTAASVAESVPVK